MKYTAEVRYKLIDGAHFYVGSDDSDLTRGLCAASSNQKKAFDEVTHQLDTLARENLGLNIKFKPRHDGLDCREWIGVDQ